MLGDIPAHTMKTGASVESAKRSRRVLRIAAWSVVVFLIYVLSFGPVWCVVRHMDHPVDTMRTIYYPLTLLGDHFTDLLEWYGGLWAPPLR